MTSSERAVWLLIIATGALTTLLILSFVATPVKFLAEDVPLEQLLAVGRVTFRASLVCEAAFVAGLMLIARGGARWLAAAASALLLIQWLFLMPLLEVRTLARMAGHQLAPSSLHVWWVVFDVTRIGVYSLILRSAVRTLMMTARTGSLAS